MTRITWIRVPSPLGRELGWGRTRNAYAEAGDEWTSAEYRREVAAVLAKRCTKQLREMNAV